MYTMAVGGCIIASAMMVVSFIVRRIRHSAAHATETLTQPVRQRFAVLFDVIVTAAKTFLLLVAWLIVVPMLLGVLCDLLALRPLRAAAPEPNHPSGSGGGREHTGEQQREQSPHSELFMLWVVGLLLLKLWFRMTAAGLAVPPMPQEWVTALTRLQLEGFETPHEVSMSVLVPLIGGIVAAIILPFMSSVIVHASWRNGSAAFLEQPVAGCAHIQAAVLLIAVEVARRAEGFLHRLNDTFRDDKYLVGRRLINFHHR
jgi:hypothetical protein